MGKVSETHMQMQTYVSKLPARARAQVLQLRDAIRLAAPEAVESFGYGHAGLVAGMGRISFGTAPGRTILVSIR
jgi:uncharacterized protein YdhG (YjbR/CyaY superfamily)